MGHKNDLCTPDGKVGICHTLEVERPSADPGLLAALCPFPSSSMLALCPSSTLFQTCPHRLLANKASSSSVFPLALSHDPLSGFCLLLLCRLLPRHRPTASYAVQNIFLCCLLSPSSAPTKLNLLLGTLRVPPTPSSNDLLYIFWSLLLGKLLLTSFVVWLGPHMLPHPASLTSGSTSQS